MRGGDSSVDSVGDSERSRNKSGYERNKKN